MTMGDPDPQVLQAILTAMQALAPMPTNTTTFDLTLGQHTVDKTIDYAMKVRRALYEEGGNALKSPFVLEVNHLITFIDVTAADTTTTFDILIQWRQFPNLTSRSFVQNGEKMVQTTA